MTNFKKIEAKTKYSQIIEQLLNLIKKGVYKAGDQLPNERALSEQMGVSRGALREALKALIVLGIIESRHGDGTYVSTDNQLRDLKGSMLGLDELPVQALIEAREIVDLGCAIRGIQHVKSEEMDKLAKCVDMMESAKWNKNRQSYLEASRDFHRYFLIMLNKDHGEAIVRIGDYLWQATNIALSKEIYEDYLEERLAVYVKSHRLILNSITKGSLPLLQEAILQHYQTVKDQLARYVS